MTPVRAANRGHRLVAALLTIAVLVGCQEATPSASPAGSVGPSSAPTGAGPAATPLGASAADVAALAALGISVWAADGSLVVPPVEPAVPLGIAEATLRDHLAAARAGHGIPGAILDELIARGDAGPAPSGVLAGYIASDDRPGAAFARSLMPGVVGTLDPGSLVFPTLALLAVEADQLREVEATAGTSSGSHPQLVDFRSVLADWTCESMLGAKQKFREEFLGEVVESYAALVGGLQWTPTGLWVPPDPALAFEHKDVQQRLVRLQLVNYLTLQFSPWSPTLRADPPATRKAIDPEAGVPGTVTVEVVDPMTPERQAAIDCARANGLDPGMMYLLERLELHPVAWSVEQQPAALVVVDSALIPDDGWASGPGHTAHPEFDRLFRDTHLDAAGTAVLRYHTASEASGDGTERTGSVVVRAQVQRPEWEALLREVYGAQLADMYPLLSMILEEKLLWSALRQDLDFAVANVSEILATTPAAITVPVTYHESDQLSVPDPCTLVTKAEVEALAGLAVWPPKRGPEEFPGDRIGTACVFGSTEVPEDNAITIGVKVAVVDLGPDAASLFADYKAGVMSQLPEAVSIQGLGDDSLAITPGGGVSSVTVRRKNIVLVIGVVSGGLEAATALARLALTRF